MSEKTRSFLGALLVAASLLSVIGAMFASMAGADVLYPVPSVTESRRPAVGKTVRAAAVSDSAFVLKRQISQDDSTWITTETDSSTNGQASLSSTWIHRGWYTRTVVDPGWTAGTGSVAVIGAASGEPTEPDRALAMRPDPALTTASNLHTFTCWLYYAADGHPNAPTDSVALTLTVESPFIDDGDGPTTGTARSDVNIGAADSCGVDWVRFQIAGKGPEGTFLAGDADSTRVDQMDIVTLSVTWAHQGSGVCIQTASVIPPDGWFEVSGMDREQIAVSGGAGASNGIVAQFRAPEPLTSPVVNHGMWKFPGSCGSAVDESSPSYWTNPLFGNRTTWSGCRGMAFVPTGDPSGPEDGYEGSLFITLVDGAQGGGGSPNTYDVTGKVGEVNIPRPTLTFNPNQMNAATSLQDGGFVRGSLWTEQNWALARSGDVYYREASGSQTSGKLYLTCFDSYNVASEDRSTLQWADTTLATPNTAGPWHVGPAAADEADLTHYLKWADYMCDVPEWFTDAYLDSVDMMLIGSGGREAGTEGASQGPTAHLIHPWDEGNPPAASSFLDAITLLAYPRVGSALDVCSISDTPLDGYNINDVYADAFWPSKAIDFGADTLNCFVVIGTHCTKTGSYYNSAYPNGYHGCPAVSGPGVCDENAPGYCCGDPNDEAPGYIVQMLFYDVDDFVDVIGGTSDPWDVQPAYTVDITGYLPPDCQPNLQSAEWDDAGNRLYVAVGHVWETNGNWRPGCVVLSLNLVE